MTTPNPSRSVSPEPTKGEELAAITTGRWSLLGVAIERHISAHIQAPDLILQTRIQLNEAESAAYIAMKAEIESAYIPLVEAAEAQRDALQAALENIRNVAISYNGEYRQLANPLARAVYVIANDALPGQQQADTEQGGG